MPQEPSRRSAGRRILLVLPTSTYRASDFLDAARAVGAEVITASEEPQALASTMGERFLQIDLCDPEAAARAVANHGARPDAIVGVDEQGVLVAAIAAEMLGLPHNAPDAVTITRDKLLTRQTLTNGDFVQPSYEEIEPHDDGTQAAAKIGFPCVIKATTLSGSRGVIRANDLDQVREATTRIRALAGDGDHGLLVEQYIPGAEVAVEGLLDGGELRVLAIFDKPDPLEGPYFEETIYVTPSRLPDATQASIHETVAKACTAIGLTEGPIHAELRLPEGGPVLLEVAARSIGGLCSRALKFGAGISLEELILRHALGTPLGDLERANAASGVMMIPIANSGVLEGVDGLDDARRVEGVKGVEITVPRGQTVQALPEGDRYLGFIFAAGDDPETVESSLREALRRLSIDIR